MSSNRSAKKVQNQKSYVCTFDDKELGEKGVGVKCTLKECVKEHPFGRTITSERCNPNWETCRGERCLKNHSPSNFPCDFRKKCKNDACTFSHPKCDHEDCIKPECLKFCPGPASAAFNQDVIPQGKEEKVKKAQKLEVDVTNEEAFPLPGSIPQKREKSSKPISFANVAKQGIEKSSAINIVKRDESSQVVVHFHREMPDRERFQVVVDGVIMNLFLDTIPLSGFEKLARIGAVIKEMSEYSWSINVKNNIITLAPKGDLIVDKCKKVIPLRLQIGVTVESELEVDFPISCNSDDTFMKMLAISNKLREDGNAGKWVTEFDGDAVIVTQI